MCKVAFASFYAGVASRRGRASAAVCCTARPPNDPTELRTESERRRNSPPKPLRRRRRRRRDEADLDWERLASVPIVRPDASPESGEDYYIDAVQLGDPDMGTQAARKRRPKKIDDRLKDKLRKEVVSPYENYWILWISAAVAVLVVLVALFGGVDSLPVISVPDL